MTQFAISFSFIVLTLLLRFDGVIGQIIEQFHIRGPSELQKIAIDTYIEEKRKNPNDDGMSENSAFMMRAKKYAELRFSSPTANELVIKVMV